MESLNQLLSRNASLLPEKPFVISDDGNLTYKELDEYAARFANVLRSIGLNKGDPVGLYLPNCNDLVGAFWGCHKFGAVPVPMSSMFREHEIRNVVNQTQMPVVVGDDETLGFFTSLHHELPSVKHVLSVNPRSSRGKPLDVLLRAASSEFQDVENEPTDIAVVFFTSGTTGRPKGAMQSQFAQYSALRDMMVFNQSRFGEEVVYCALPLTNNMACTCMMNQCMFAGGTMILHKRWDTRQAMDAIRDHKVTFMAGPPTVYIYMSNEFDARKDDLSTLRLCITGGAPVPPEVVQRFESISGARLAQGYGATEVTGYVTADPLVGDRRIGSAGLAIGSSKVEIIDDVGRPLKAGEIGEVRVSGDWVGSGYWGDPETTAASFTNDGWLSGDIGKMDEDGYLYIVDRKKDLIISGGFNIYPAEVENILYGHPDVALCAVVGMPDNEKGEIPVAFIVKAPGSSLSESDFTGYCRERISAYKAPRRVFLRDALPTSAIGKILKRELRASLARHEDATATVT